MTVSTMVRIQVTKHRCVNIRRSSLCDNCCVQNCTSFNSSRITECMEFRPVLTVFLKCRNCGRVYDPYRSLRSLDYELCPECNHSEEGVPLVSLVCRE